MFFIILQTKLIYCSSEKEKTIRLHVHMRRGPADLSCWASARHPTESRQKLELITCPAAGPVTLQTKKPANELPAAAGGGIQYPRLGDETEQT